MGDLEHVYDYDNIVLNFKRGFDYATLYPRYDYHGIVDKQIYDLTLPHPPWMYFANTKLLPNAPLAISGSTFRSRLRKLYKWLIKNQGDLKWHQARGPMNGITFHNGQIYTAFPHAINTAMQYHCIACARPFDASIRMRSRKFHYYEVAITAYVCETCSSSICTKTFFDTSTCARVKVTFALCISGLIKDIRRLLIARIDKCDCGRMFVELSTGREFSFFKFTCVRVKSITVV